VARAYRAWVRGADGSAAADRELARALELAEELGDTNLLAALRRIEDPERGGHVRAPLKDVDWQHLILSSAMTTAPRQPIAGPPAADPSPPPGTDVPDPDDLVECPDCGWIGPADSVYCGGPCGRLLGGAV
jgi:hypothetical protein